MWVCVFFNSPVTERETLLVKGGLHFVPSQEASWTMVDFNGRAENRGIRWGRNTVRNNRIGRHLGNLELAMLFGYWWP